MTVESNAIAPFGELMRTYRRSGASFDGAWEAAWRRVHFAATETEMSHRQETTAALRETRDEWERCWHGVGERLRIPDLIGWLDRPDDEPEHPPRRIEREPLVVRRDRALQALAAQHARVLEAAERARNATRGTRPDPQLSAARDAEREAENRLVERAYRSGASLQEVGEALGLDASAVLHRLRSRGVRTRSPGPPAGVRAGRRYALIKEAQRVA